MVVAVVALGGAAGALLRYALGTAFPDPSAGFPWTVLTINVVGSLVLALLPALAVVRRRELLPPMLGPGLLGGFTTLSTYAEQGRALLADGRTGLATTYLLGTLVACLAAVALGTHLTRLQDRRVFEAEEGDR